jgi:hypothetical protein
MSKAKDFILELKINKYDPTKPDSEWKDLEDELENDLVNLGFFWVWVRESDRSVWRMVPHQTMAMKGANPKFPHGCYRYYIAGNTPVFIPAEEVKRVRK